MIVLAILIQFPVKFDQFKDALEKVESKKNVIRFRNDTKFVADVRINSNTIFIDTLQHSSNLILVNMQIHIFTRFAYVSIIASQQGDVKNKNVA